MAIAESKTVAVCGATGRQGGAVARHLLERGWHVRALTRDPSKPKARALADRGAEVVRADMGDRGSLEAAIGDAAAVFSVQNSMISGLDGEVQQGKHVADAAKAAGVRHVVYGSAGVGARTGVGSWDSKLTVEEHLRALRLPVTVLRPMAFMELMSDKDLYPPIAMWHLMPKLVGSAKIPWLAVDDLGAIAALAFEGRDRFVGQTLSLSADVQSVGECRAIWTEERGRAPRRFPMPVRLFERFGGKDLTAMWRWLRTGSVPLDSGPTRQLRPQALTVRDWIRKAEEGGQRNAE
jgi:uncharacterized protein YbjT (DUF2867 family)